MITGTFLKLRVTLMGIKSNFHFGSFDRQPKLILDVEQNYRSGQEWLFSFTLEI